MNGHFIKKCSKCGAVIAQCRCMDRDKSITWGICETCVKAAKNLKPEAK